LRDSHRALILKAVAARRNEVQALFQAALDRPPGDRADFLDTWCHDMELRSEVDRLLASHESPRVLDTKTRVSPHSKLTAAEAASLERGARLGPYKIVDFLGAGGMGEVYLARDTRLDLPVALKILPDELVRDPERLARFQREGRAASALCHAHICAIHEIGEADGRPFIAMEFVPGQSLDVRLAIKPFTVDEVIDIGIQLADALDEAREKHIVHRDLKSANIVLTPRGQVKVLDFGVAKRIGDTRDPRSQTGLTKHGAVVGTLAYMSPEQASGGAVDHRSDLFSLGIVLYELLSGRRPFVGSSAAGVALAVIFHPPPPIGRKGHDVPEPLQRVVMRLLEKDPQRRYQTGHEVLVELLRLKGV
jgi:serine/threonine protein kinase